MLERRAWHLPKFVRLQSQGDLLLGFLLAVGVFVLYVQTLVPSVLDGDQGEFQYIPAILGIPHPTGFPLYVLIGHLWSLLPIGNLAYRMNLFSAFSGALTIGALFVALRRQNLHIVAAAGGALTLAILPEYWLFSTAAAVYRLHDLLIVLLFAFLAEWQQTRAARFLWLAALAFGFDLTNHLTILFLAPATGIFVLSVAGRAFLKQPRAYFIAAGFLFLPFLLYLYFPLRASQLASNGYVLPDWLKVFAQGIVSSHYENTPAGFFNFINGRTFFNYVTGYWVWKWDTLIADWSTLLFEAFNLPVFILALVGAIHMSFRRTKLALWLIGNAILFQLLALQYSYSGLEAIGEFSPYAREYYLPSFICLVVLMAWGVNGILGWIQMNLLRLKLPDFIASTTPAFMTGVLLISAIGDLAARHPTDLIDRSSDIQAQWDEIKEFPPAPNAALVGHWGDLTPLWYFQQAEGWRNDLIAIHPPDEKLVAAWMASGKPLYLAGSLLGWAPSISKDYNLTAWGRLVRVTNEKYSPPSPLMHDSDWVFVEDRPVLRLLGYQVSSDILDAGETLELDLYWESLDSISFDDYLVYLSLENERDSTPEKDYALAVNWLSVKQFNPGQRALSIYRYRIPRETTAGRYSLRLLLYSIRNATNLRASGNVSGDRIEITQININRTPN